VPDRREDPLADEVGLFAERFAPTGRCRAAVVRRSVCPARAISAAGETPAAAPFVIAV